MKNSEFVEERSYSRCATRRPEFGFQRYSVKWVSLRHNFHIANQFR